MQTRADLKKSHNGPLFLRLTYFLGLRGDGNEEGEEEEEGNDDYVPFEALDTFGRNLTYSHPL